MSCALCRGWRLFALCIVAGLALGLVGKAVSKEPAGEDRVRIMAPEGRADPEGDRRSSGSRPLRSRSTR